MYIYIYVYIYIYMYIYIYINVLFVPEYFRFVNSNIEHRNMGPF